MKLRKSMFRFLAFVLLSAGAFFALSNQSVEAMNCVLPYSACVDACWTADPAGGILNTPEFRKCVAKCMTNEMSCAAYQGWQNWLLSVDLNIGDNFRILDEPDPACAMFADAFDNCGNLETAEDIEVCTMTIQQEQARFHCP